MTHDPETSPSLDSQLDEQSDLRDEVLGLLGAPTPSLPAKLHYDERGSELFEEICDQPEYTLTRDEIALMREHAGAISGEVGPGVTVLEPGSGASVKTSLLLGALEDCAGYIPIEISHAALEAASARIAESFPDLAVMPIHADFTQPFRLEHLELPDADRLVYFPGSSMGNFTPEMQTTVLASFAQLAGMNGALLVGFDLVKGIAAMEAAYNDIAGVTAAFNLNMIDRLSNEFDLPVKRTWFRFESGWDETRQAIVSYVVPDRAIAFEAGGHTVRLAKGTRIQTEESHKYTPDRITSLASSAGLSVDASWINRQTSFAVCLLRPMEAS
ncbi:MAG: L-histidine N(alpha)-methyltransferase [Planctomycetota bacterium]